MQKYLEELNENQRNAVKYIDGPSLIIAGAGSGKTRVLTYKIVHLIKQGIEPWSILALTFTNKAAREMKERMVTLTDEAAVNSLWMGTFHSIFARILRIESAAIGFPSTFTISDTDDSKKLVTEIIKELKLDPNQYPVGDVYKRISMAKNNLVIPSVYETDIEIQKQDLAAKRPDIARIYNLYFVRCKRSAVMDFDDLLLYTNILFRDNAEILKKYQDKFRFVLVDEYQDTNYSQYLIIKKLSSVHHKICVVGDDSQSIYSFRGAKIENILNFKNDFKDYELFKLEQNYRSTKHIVNAANSLIEKNRNRIPKVVFTENEEGEKILVKEFEDDKLEALYVAKAIKKISTAENFKFNDFAILYRTNVQSRAFEDTFRRNGIPYKIFGSISFYQRAEIKDIVAYLRLLINKNDDLAIKRIINYPKRGIGTTTVDKIEEVANSNNVCMWDVICQIEKLNKILNTRAILLIKQFQKLINDLTLKSKESDAVELVNTLLEKTDIKATMSEDKSPEGVNKYDNVQEFVNYVQEWSSRQEENANIENFLEEIALATDQDNDKKDTDRVSLMTIHAAKGLEFKVVFAVGVEEGTFPGFRSVNIPAEIEEERRLFYVAITRSEKYLFITHAKRRMKWGQYQQASKSRFIKEIDNRYLFNETIEENSEQIFDNNKEYSKFALKSQSSFPKEPLIDVSKPKKLKSIDKFLKIDKKVKQTDEQTGLSIGMIVNHVKFGKGKIIQLEGDYPDTKAIVDFEKEGQKNLLLKFAKLTVID